LEATVTVPLGAERVTMLGAGDRNLKIIRETIGVNVAARDRLVKLTGEPQAVNAAKRVLAELESAAERREHLSRQQVLQLVSTAITSPSANDHDNDFDPDDPNAPPAPPRTLAKDWAEHLHVYTAGHRVAPKTPAQRTYLNAIRDHDIVFGIGPAGTGKTYLAVAAAVHLLKVGLTRKVILVRPAVEAGERLGFLPGGLAEKVNPYLRPLFDALHDMMDFATIQRFIATDVVEIVPLAYMRGRTLNNATIILDEAQNATKGQMQMFLTRMGHGSKIIVTGDTTQIDLPDPTQSGLIDAARRLRRVKGIAFVILSKQDIVRHPLVQRVVEAYGQDSEDPILKLPPLDDNENNNDDIHNNSSNA